MPTGLTRLSRHAQVDLAAAALLTAGPDETTAVHLSALPMIRRLAKALGISADALVQGASPAATRPRVWATEAVLKFKVLAPKPASHAALSGLCPLRKPPAARPTHAGSRPRSVLGGELCWSLAGRALHRLSRYA